MLRVVPTRVPGACARAAFALLVLGGACAPAGDPDAGAPGAAPRNLLLVTLDTTRADRLGCYGHAGAATPTLDGLAADGVLFETCVSATPTTLPSHATLLTGLEPFTHGARNNGTHRLPADVETLAERLRARGFATGAVVSAFVLDARFGLDQGFDRYDDDLSGGTGASESGYRETRADDAARRARAWLEQRGDERWFLWLHLFDPHADYAPPEPFATRFAADPYDGEIAWADAVLGELLAWLDGRGELDETLVVATADHGESLGEHGEATHGVFVYDATTRVPLLLRHPSLPAGTRVGGVAAAADVAPTALELLGLGAPDGLDGRSLAAAARGGAAPERAAYSESLLPLVNYGWSDLAALRDARHRYVRAPRPELYDLAADPGETRDLSSTSPDVASRLAADLAARVPSSPRDERRWTVADLEGEARASLAALGYVFDERAGDAVQDERADPKDRVRAIARQQEAEGLRLAGRLDDAEAAYRALLAKDPAAVPVRDALAALLAERGKLDEAAELHRGSLALPGASVENLLDLAELERRLGAAGWERSLALAKELDPRDPRPWVREGDHVHLGRDAAAARAAYERALALDERCAEAWLGLCRLAIAERDAPAAARAAQRATEADPTLHEAWFQLGAMRAAGGDLPEAVRCFERARDLAPEHAPTRIRLALVLTMSGRDADAVPELRRALELDRAEVERTARASPPLADLLRRAR